jgi:hypothetical protein
MPAPIFWAYFVGFALFAAATSIALNKHARLAASLTGLMFILFVLMIHLPNAVANPKVPFFWVIVCRETSFACGLFLFANRIPSICRIALGAILIFFAIQTFLHPLVIPGVPLLKLTPTFIPLRALWGYLTALALFVGGASLLLHKYARTATTVLGLVMIALVVFMYFPILAAAPPAGLVEALNYIGDTTLFGGTILLAAGAMPTGK